MVKKNVKRLYWTAVMMVSMGLSACDSNQNTKIVVINSQPKRIVASKPVNTNNKALKKPNNNVPTAIQWQWPADGLILTKARSLEIAGRPGTPIKAAAGGVVSYSGHGLKQYGNLIIIKHNQDFSTVYAHNRELKVKEGEKVTKGQVIALMGKSGAERVRLHFEIRYKGKPQDPIKYLPKI